jgi:hypothetical protein
MHHVLFTIGVTVNLMGFQRFGHIYFIVRIELQDVEAGSKMRLWARCERLVASGLNPSIFVAIRDLWHEALDMICISSDSSSLHRQGSDNNLHFQRSFNGNLTMLHVIDLLHGIHENSPQYRIQTHNRWYAATAISVLDLFVAEFSINSRKDYLPSYLKFPPNVPKSSREILRLYTLKWFPAVMPVPEVPGVSVKLEGEKSLSVSTHLHMLPLLIDAPY